MPGERYVVLGLAHARSGWFRRLAQWANSASIPAEFVKCISGEELRARLDSGRPFSAIVADAAVPALDRDLVHRAQEAGCAVLVVADGRVVRDWSALGVSAVVPLDFSREELLEALGQHARMIGRGDALPSDETDPSTLPAWRGRVAAVCGAGGTGVSTVAIALAQGLADDPQRTGSVLLADLCRHAEQAMLHDARDVVPGVQELAEAHRSGRPTLEDVRALTYDVVDRRYHLLLGLRRSRFWTTLRPRAFEAGFDSLRRAYHVVVCDTDTDLEGEDDGGSIEVEERNVMTRTAVSRADAVFTVGSPTMKGLHSLVRVVHDLVAFGVPPAQIVPVLNRAPRNPRQRAAATAALADLAAPVLGGDALAGTVLLPERRVEEALRDSVRLPPALTDSLAAAYDAAVAAEPARRDERVPVAVVPGALGSWA